MRMISYYQIELTADVIELYHNALKSYDVDSIAVATGQHIKTCKWFPKICELNELLKEHVPQLESKATDQAALVILMVSQNGYLNEPVWEDAITRHLFQRRFKWRSLCDTLTDDENKWFVKDFIQAYTAANDMCDGNPELLEAPKEFLQIANGLFKSIT